MMHRRFTTALAFAAVVAVLGAGAVRAAPEEKAEAAWPAGLPKAERFVLPNGLTVLLVADPENPILDVELAFKAGGGADPSGKEGLASMVGRMLTAGVDGLDEQALAKELARLGAQVAPEVATDTFQFGGQVPTFSDGEVRRFLGLFFQMVRAPTLPAAVLEREKTLRLGLLGRIADNAEAVVEVAAKLAAMGQGPWGRPVFGNATAVAGLTRDDVVRFHRAVLQPKNAVLAIGGAFDPGAMRTYLERELAGWGVDTGASPGGLPGRMARLCAVVDEQDVCFANATAYAPTRSAGLPYPRTIHVVVDDPGLTQIPWRLSGPNPVAMVDAQWPAFRLGVFALGGDFTSRLNTRLRTKEGLTYGAYFDPGFGGHVSGAMMISTDATADALERSISIGTEEVQALLQNDLSEEELGQVKALLVEGFAFKFETILDTVDQYLTLEVAGVPITWLAGWRQALLLPSAAEIRKALGPLDLHHMTLVVAGPASLGPTLAALKHGEVTTLTAKDLLERGLGSR